MGPERPRKRYRIRNWREYDRGLIGRGDLTLWFSSDLPGMRRMARGSGAGLGCSAMPPFSVW
jgi:hypothetical protein